MSPIPLGVVASQIVAASGPRLDATSSNSPASNSTSQSWSHTCASGATRLLVAIGHNQSTVGTSTVTYNGVSLSHIGNSQGSNGSIELWELASPPSGTHTIAATMTAAGFNPAIAASFTGTGTSAASGLQNPGRIVTNPATVTVSSSVGDLVIVIGYNRTTTQSGSGGLTVAVTNTQANATQLGYLVATGTSTTAGYTTGTDDTILGCAIAHA